MALQITTNINVDFCDKKYILINAKQLDKNSRFISVTCYNHGELYPLYAGEHSAYIRYKKPDGYSVFNFCNINNKGKILVELTEQMLVCEGICYADLVIVNSGDARVDSNTGKIVTIDNASILSTMTFCIDVSEGISLNPDIESTYEFNLLNTNLEKYWTDFEDVMKTSKSWAVGSTGIRDDESTNNSQYYSEQSLKYASESEKFSISASGNADNANTSMTKALEYKGLAETYMDNAQKAQVAAEQAAANAAGVAAEQAAQNAVDNVSVLMSGYVSDSQTSANISKSYAVGGTGTRENENADNAKHYYELTKNMVDTINNIATVDEVKSYLGI